MKSRTELHISLCWFSMHQLLYGVRFEGPMLAIYFIIISGINARTSHITLVWANLKGFFFVFRFVRKFHSIDVDTLQHTYICEVLHLCRTEIFLTKWLTVIDEFSLIQCTIEQYQLNECNNLWDFFFALFLRTYNMQHGILDVFALSLCPFASTTTYSSAICVYDVLFDIFKVQVSTFRVCHQSSQLDTHFTLSTYSIHFRLN